MKLKWVWQKVKKLNLKWWNKDGKGKPKSYPTPDVNIVEENKEVIVENTQAEVTVDLSQPITDSDVILSQGEPTTTMIDGLDNVSVASEVATLEMTTPVQDILPAGCKKGEWIVGTSEKAELLEMRRRLEACLAQLDKVIATK